MYRRRRPTREIAFSFDSFLDMVANVVGVIIRLILVVWVGARTYTGIVAPPPENPPAAEATAEDGEPGGVSPGMDIAMPTEPPLDDALRPHQEELARLQQQLLSELRTVQQHRDDAVMTAKEIAALTARNVELEHEIADLDQAAAAKRQDAKSVTLTAEQLQARYRKLSDDIAELKKLPSAKKTLRYRTPVSEPLFSEELEFECNDGRVTFIETHTLIEEVKREFATRKEEFFGRDSSVEHVEAVGAFRAVFRVQRERDVTPRISITEGYFEPITSPRGESLDESMKPHSAFRQIADVIDSQRTAVTFWVYPDSFALYRQLRDYLYDRNITVAARPIPAGVPIGWSKHGTAARGQ